MVSKRCGSASVAGLGIAECDAVLNGGLLPARLGIPLSDAGIKRKPSGEIGLDLKESVREADVYIIKCVPPLSLLDSRASRHGKPAAGVYLKANLAGVDTSD